uniref:Gram-positive signal peptide protein, YSIRK family n=1 Tax=Heterorhabditis bacteriophora TaxID=37862 RepID=A0A1I7WL59_HETBA
MEAKGSNKLGKLLKIGIVGIVALETRHTFHLITKQDKYVGAL